MTKPESTVSLKPTFAHSPSKICSHPLCSICELKLRLVTAYTRTLSEVQVPHFLLDADHTGQKQGRTSRSDLSPPAFFAFAYTGTAPLKKAKAAPTLPNAIVVVPPQKAVSSFSVQLGHGASPSPQQMVQQLLGGARLQHLKVTMLITSGTTHDPEEC